MFPYEFFSEFYFAGHWSQQSTCRMSAFCNVNWTLTTAETRNSSANYKLRIKVNKDQTKLLWRHKQGLNISTNQIRLRGFWSKRHQYGICSNSCPMWSGCIRKLPSQRKQTHFPPVVLRHRKITSAKPSRKIEVAGLGWSRTHSSINFNREYKIV